MGNLEQDIWNAFALESEGTTKYIAMEQKAEAEKLPNMAKLFRTFVQSETVHALAHLRTLAKFKNERLRSWQIGDTNANLKNACEGEVLGYTKFYPDMIKDAEEEKDNAAAKFLGFLCEVEKEHAEIFEKALKDPSSFKNDAEYYVCTVCGYIHEGPCDKCPVCGVGANKFKKVD